MYWILIFVLACQTQNTVEELFNPNLPWRTVLDDPPIKLCVLPPYPKNGGYVVVNEPDAQPGDRFETVTIVTHELVSSNQYVQFKEFTCSNGQWRESLFQYSSETLYFNTSWCPVICPLTVAASVPVPPPPSLTDTFKFINETLNPESNNLCILPPYPDRGSYYVKYLRDPRPGTAHTSFALVQYTLVKDRDDLYEVKQLDCNAGSWSIRLYSTNDDKLSFERNVWCHNLCSKFSPKKSSESLVKPSNKNFENSKRTSDVPKCQLPPFPENGKYTAANKSGAEPGDAFDAVRLEYSCSTDHEIVGSETVFCIDGVWSARAPECKSKTDSCLLPPKPLNGNYVILDGSNTTNVALDFTCDRGYVIDGRAELDCIDGKWPGEPPNCIECGVETIRKVGHHGRRKRQLSDMESPESVKKKPRWNRRKGGHASAGRKATINELPWHVGIYKKNLMQYMQICSGSMISLKLVVSAAHCFWSDIEGVLPASRFAVAAGKRFRPWNDTSDNEAQFSDVSEIRIPPRFRGGQTNFQDDVALLVLATPFVNGARVRPVCLDFDLDLDREQLAAGTLGKVAGWGLTTEDGNASHTLQVVELPSVEIGQCISDASPDFRQYITSDKICAGYTNGTSLCKGDSGGGLVFPKMEAEKKRYYLRGVASTAPNNDKLCNTHAVPTFTQILQHEHFIKDYFNGKNA